MTIAMVKMESLSMPVCKLNFDEDEDLDYTNFSSPNMSPEKNFVVNGGGGVDDVHMDMIPEDHSFAMTRQIKMSNGRLFSPRKPLRTYNQTNGLSSNLTSPTGMLRSYKGYHVSPTNSISPPDKKVRALRLFDSPNTPKTLLQRSSQSTPTDSQAVSRVHSVSRPSTRSRLFASNRGRHANTHNGSTPFTGFHSMSEAHHHEQQHCDTGSTSGGSSSKFGTTFSCSSGGGKEPEVKDMRANVNPFTPTNIMLSSRKRSRKSKKMNSSKDESSGSIDRNFTPLTNNNNNIPHSKNNNSFNQDDAMDCSSGTTTITNNNTTHHQHHNLLHHNHSDTEDSASTNTTLSGASSDEDAASDDEEDEDDNPSKRIAIHDVNVSRYHKEFVEVSLIGRGVFGSVYLCRHRLDGCLYAIKRSLKPVAGSSNERTALNEVYAHAVLGAHQHVVRYYSAWAEDDHMIIQNEYCNGGSLAHRIEKNTQKGRTFSEEQIKTILLHLAKGLKFIHSLHMVHLDVKPDNIFISCERSKHNAPNEDSADDGFEEDSTIDDGHTEFTYKIGDLGHVTSVMNPKVEEGDCRYLPRELLQDDYSALQKVDIFALGLTLYEAATGSSLPLNGSEWQDIRNGELPDIPNFSRCLQDLLKLMIHNDPKMRPTASQLINHEVFNVSSASGSDCKSKGQLRRELEEAKLKNEILEKELLKAKHFIQHLSPGTPSSLAVLNNLEDADGSFCITSTTGEPEKTAPGSTMEDGGQSAPKASLSSNGVVQCEMDSSVHSTDSNTLFPANNESQCNNFQSLLSGDCATTSNLHTQPSSTNNESSPSFLNGNNVNFTLGSNGSNTCNNTTNQQQVAGRQYHYNTRSQQMFQLKQKYQAAHSRFVGKKTVRSQSVL